MDVSPEYIKQCDCPEIRGERTYNWERGDYWWDGYQVHINPKDDFPYVASTTTPLTWLPRQDQLQEMVGDRPDYPWDLAYTFGFFCNPMKCVERPSLILDDEFYEGNPPESEPEIVLNQPQLDYPRQFTSMEQLWLAFVMKEKYGKVWDGSKWVQTNNVTAPTS